jgi:putative ABC transport system permease protein
MLLVAEVALAVVLVVGAGLLIRSLRNLQHVAPGYRTADLLIVNFELTGARYPFPRHWPVNQWTEHEAFTRSLRERLEAVPGIASFALAQEGPTSGGWTTRVTVEGQPAIPEGEQPEAGFRPVGPDYFTTLGVPVAEGRAFTRFDTSDKPLVAIVNRAFVKRHFAPGERVLGRSIRVFGEPREIVGVVGDVHFEGLAQQVSPAMYLPLAQNPMSGVTLIVRAEGDPMALLPAIRKQFAAVDPDVALFGITTADGALRHSLAERRFSTFLLTLLAAVALVLAFVGVYGVLSYTVAQRTREMGVRLALGARPRDVVLLVAGQGMALVGAALAIGIAASLGASRALASLLFGVGRVDPLTLLAVTLLLGTSAGVACYVPARRAGRVDPLASLRVE